MWQNEKVLVTGGMGFLGGAIVRRLHGLGCRDIRIFCRSPHKGDLPEGVSVLNGDLRGAGAVLNACESRSIIFHAAAKAGIWGRRQDFFEINVKGTENIIAACRKHKVPCLVYTSSPSVVIPPDGDLENADESIGYPSCYLATYPETKAVAENLVLSSNSTELATVSLRPHLIWGPGDPHILPRIAARARARKLMRVGDGKNLVDITYVDNAAEAHVLAAQELRTSQKCAGKAYFISDGTPVNLWDWINRLLEKTGIPQVDKSISFKKAYLIGGVMEMLYGALHLSGEPPMTRFTAAQLAHSHYFDISAARKDFGYVPVISCDDALERTAAWLRNLYTQ